ncbi:High-affinity zinc uptake system membrane protein ZnuB [Zhongshania aliphaticivorans]|uniref:High-affinity zinc uptake system membrane protein ZnuB n=1 Tax=Zhongshania aliphaticivorans TaxID=1470434 RepID=A0A5S9PLS8_9GAMM|nr:metal ABC transporter permease [Zhongshania aliphaticivorans]CAA0104854.1 High-affinity zinc uptake system membrane protein ZnuB [Zhongshania aliphaticivorans]CAA0105155.1 High-affinity zinc uptake system membrane protein ZnuB [Zhongshania aliphaticivorans]
MIDILLYALIAGLLVAALCGPLGALVTWQRMAYYGDTLAHSALLGLALGLALQLNLQYSVLFTCLLIGFVLFVLQWWRDIALDSLLGILSHSSLALGLVLISFLDNMQLDLNAFLFGDLLAIEKEDLISLGGICFLVFALLCRYWHALVAVTAHAELAEVEGLPVKRLRLLLMLMVAATVAVAMKIVGVLLITAMLIIPASAAGRFARSPEQAAILAIICGAIAVIAGLAGAWYWDTPAGPSIVLGAGGLFVLGQLAPSYRRK